LENDKFTEGMMNVRAIGDHVVQRSGNARASRERSARIDKQCPV
jgi:hypothetical protein